MANPVVKGNEGRSWDFDTNSLVSGLPTAAVKTDSHQTYDHHYDVIVIGAGFTGLVAARDLYRQGRKVLVLEARDRIGGRAWAAQGKHHEYEMGGGWIHYLQPHVWAELTRYGMTNVSASLPLDSETVISVRGQVQDVTKGDNDFGRLIIAFFDVDGQGGRAIMPNPYLPLGQGKEVAVWDISCQERIEQLKLSTVETDLLTSIFSTFGLTEVGETGFLSILRLYLLSGSNIDQLFEMNGKFKMPGGTTGLANAIYDEFQGTSLFNRKVKSIESSSNGARVVTDKGESFTADYVVNTLPVNCLPDVQINVAPSVPFDSVKQINLGGKLHIHAANPDVKWLGVADVQSMASFGIAESRSKVNGTNYVMFLSSKAPLSEGIEAHPVRVMNETLSTMFPKSMDMGRVDGIYWHDWRADELAKGAWAVYGPGALSGNVGTLMRQRTIGERIMVASSDLANGWVGYMDGAIEEGRRVAFQIGSLGNAGKARAEKGTGSHL